MEENQGKVGPFFYLDGSVISDAMIHSKAENYGVFKTWSSHDKFWTILGKTKKQYQTVEYFIYPRGRVTYNTEKDIFYIYLNPNLKTAPILEKIRTEFNLGECDCIFNDTDVHYKIYTKEELDDLMGN